MQEELIPVEKIEPLTDDELYPLDIPNYRRREYIHVKKNGYVQKTHYVLKREPITPEMILDMKNMLLSGVKRKVICEKYNFTYQTLKKYLAM